MRIVYGIACAFFGGCSDNKVMTPVASTTSVGPSTSTTPTNVSTTMTTEKPSETLETVSTEAQTTAGQTDSVSTATNVPTTSVAGELITSSSESPSMAPEQTESTTYWTSASDISTTNTEATSTISTVKRGPNLPNLGKRVVGLMDAVYLGIKSNMEGSQAVWDGLGIDMLLGRLDQNKGDPRWNIVMNAALLVSSELASRSDPSINIAEKMKPICTAHAEKLEKILTKELSLERPKDDLIRGIRTAGVDEYRLNLVHAPRANFDLICPDLLHDSLAVRLAVVQDKILRRQISQHSDSVTVVHLQLPGSDARAALQSGLMLMSEAGSESLRQGAHFEAPVAVSRAAWFYRYAKLIFSTPLFEESQGAWEVGSAGTGKEYKAVGRFVGMAVLDNVPLGLTLGNRCARFILGRETKSSHSITGADAETIQRQVKRYDALARGFREVVNLNDVEILTPDDLIAALRGTKGPLEIHTNDGLFDGDFVAAITNGISDQSLVDKLHQQLAGSPAIPIGGFGPGSIVLILSPDERAMIQNNIVSIPSDMEADEVVSALTSYVSA